MKKIKIFLLLFTYVSFVFIIILSYNAIVPEENIPLIENSKNPMVVVIDNKFKPNNESVYDIIENKDEARKTLSKKQETIKKNQYKIEEDVSIREEFYRLQVASFNREKKSMEISKLINKRILEKQIELKFIVKKVVFPNKKVFYRVLSFEKFNQMKAQSTCKQILEISPQCILVKADETKS